MDGVSLEPASCLDTHLPFLRNDLKTPPRALRLSALAGRGQIWHPGASEGVWGVLLSAERRGAELAPAAEPSLRGGLVLRAGEQLGATHDLPGQEQGGATWKCSLVGLGGFFFPTALSLENKNAVVSCPATFSISSPLTIF